MSPTGASSVLTVVVIDDDLDYRLIVRALLRPLADVVAVIGEAEDGEEGLAVVRRSRPDIVITDLMMPRMNGIALAGRIREELPQTKIILMSSHVEDAYRMRVSDSPVDVFINKHVITTALVPAIREVVSRRRSNGGASSAAPPK
ncbi:MAG TPA: response regulator transcription factor [Methylomirabilota bacterium]|nr:response regulator transcription factor [Methylomirabilota bacterium]